MDSSTIEPVEDPRHTLHERTMTRAAPPEDVVSTVRAYIVRSLACDISDTDNFFQRGLVSSLFGMQLITFIEKSFDCEITDEDLVLDNFASIHNISHFVWRKRTQR